MENGHFVKLHNTNGKRRNISGSFVQPANNPLNSWLAWILVLLISLLLLLIGILIATGITADRVNRNSCNSFQYEIPFVCGVNPSAPGRVRPGTYATSVIIINPNNDQIEFSKKIALSFPSGNGTNPGLQKSGFVSNNIVDSLNSCETLMVDCEEIVIKNEFNISLEVFPPYIIGVVIIQSESSLTVWAEQTVTTISVLVKRNIQNINSTQYDNEIPSLSVNRAEERCIKGGSFFDSFYK